MFNLCFDTGLLPSIWRKAMITPIPKDATTVCLLSIVSKLYSYVLNNRLLNYLEDEKLLAEEQNENSPVKIMSILHVRSYVIDC